MFCELINKIKSEFFDLNILCVNECENELDIMKEDCRKMVEVEFFKGVSVIWWNLWFKEYYVLKRCIYIRLYEMVKFVCLKFDDED